MTQQPDWLVQTKLQPPLLHADTIVRERLLEALRSAVSTRLVTLISAPAGYGKTTLLASLPQLLPELRVAWLTLDDEDNDPARFLAALLAALQRLNPEVGAGAGQHLAAAPRRVITMVINDVLAHLPEPFALVLDDLHFVTDPRVHAALDFLIERLPPQMRLVIATRHDPPLALARLTARRQMAEIRRPHLAFTADEVARFLNDTLGLQLGPEDLATLIDRTEGWAAGLCLLASSLDRMSTDAGRTALVSSLAHTDRYVFDFLATEVLNHQEPETRTFLLQTSILAELTPATAAAVTERSDAGRLLAELYRKNLFLVAGGAGAYRYHALFADFLRGQLAEEQPAALPELHRRAALAQTAVTRAVAHFLAAQLYAEAVAKIEAVGEQCLLLGLAGTMRNWSEKIPAHVKESHPRLCFLLSRALLSVGDYPGTYALANLAHDGCARTGDVVGMGIALNVLCSIDMIVSDLPAYRAHTARFGALGNLPRPMQARYQAALAYLHACDQRWEEAATAIRASLALAMEGGDLSAAADILYRFGPWVVTLPGCLEPLEQFCRWVEGLSPAENSALRLAAADRIALTELLRGHLDGSVAAAERTLAIKEEIGGYVWIGMVSAGSLATVALIRGDQAAATNHVETLLRFTNESANAQREFWSYVLGRTYWLLGQPEMARAMLGRIQDPGLPNRFPLGQVLEQRLAGLLALSAHLPAVAEAAFRAAVAVEEQYPMTLAAGSARVLLVRALAEQNRMPEAVAELKALLVICDQRGMPGLLLQEGMLIRPVLQTIAGGGGPGSSLAAIALSQLGAPDLPAALSQLNAPHDPGTAPVPRPPQIAPLAEPLTDREHDVLRLLAAGAINREIASALIIGEETVKTHVAHILRKLNVPARTQAGARARELGLI